MHNLSTKNLNITPTFKNYWFMEQLYTPHFSEVLLQDSEIRGHAIREVNNHFFWSSKPVKKMKFLEQELKECYELREVFIVEIM